jgi:hypothetical protein
VRLRRRRGDVEDVGADRGEDVGPEAAILPLFEQHLSFLRERRAGDSPDAREAMKLPGEVEVENYVHGVDAAGVQHLLGFRFHGTEGNQRRLVAFAHVGIDA